MSFKIKIDIDEQALKTMIVDHLRRTTQNDALMIEHVRIEVKSKQNWKSEWERADFRAVYEGEI